MTSKNRIPARSEQTTYKPPVYDPVEGRAALQALAPTIDALPESELLTIRVDVGAAMIAALGVVGFLSAPEVRACFAELPPRAFDMADLDGLRAACFATLHALDEARAAGALATEAKLPSAIVAEAGEVEARMQALCEHHFKDDPDIRPELDRLRPGTGYRDLAGDLRGYARIYELRPEVVSADPTHYRPGDVARARKLAGEILAGVAASMTPRARTAYDRYVRAWAFVNKRYDEVRATGLWLFRNDPLREQRFPSLFAAARPNGGRPKKGTTKGRGDAPVE